MYMYVALSVYYFSFIYPCKYADLCLHLVPLVWCRGLNFGRIYDMCIYIYTCIYIYMYSINIQIHDLFMCAGAAVVQNVLDHYLVACLLGPHCMCKLG